MGILTSAASANDLDLLPWKKVILLAEPKTCENYATGFFGMVNDADTVGSANGYAAARILAFLCSLRLHADDLITPFRSTIPDVQVSALDDRDIQFLREIESFISDHDLLARVRDLLWVLTKDGRAGDTAIDSYIDSALQLLPQNAFNAIERFERAGQLSLALRKKEKRQKIAGYISAFLEQEQNPLTFTITRFGQLLLLLDSDRGISTAQRLSVLAERASLEKKPDLQRRALELAAEFYRYANDIEKQRQALLAHAQTYVDEAEILAATPNMNLARSAHCVECAIHALRKLGSTKERVEKLRHQLNIYQAQSVRQMVPLSEEINVDEIAMRVREHVTRSTIREAIFALANVSRPRKVAELIKLVRQHNDQYLARFIFGNTIVSNSGKTVARHKPMSKDDDEMSDAFRGEMYRLAVLGRQVVAQGLIEPGRTEIAEQHSIRFEDVADLVWNNPLVPVGREPLFTIGILWGFRGDYLLSSHVLIPQIEHMIRSLLATKGHLTSGFDHSGIQDEHDLNTTLRHTELPKLLGEDLVFEIRGLLTERFGSNLRNELAHGLRAYEQFFVADTAYCWWLVLHMLCAVRITNNSHGTKNESEK